LSWDTQRDGWAATIAAGVGRIFIGGADSAGDAQHRHPRQLAPANISSIPRLKSCAETDFLKHPACKFVHSACLAMSGQRQRSLARTLLKHRPMNRGTAMSPETQVLVEMATRSFSVSGDGDLGWSVAVGEPGGGLRYGSVDELVFALINLTVGIEGSA